MTVTHPAMMRAFSMSPFLFQDLVRTYVEINHIYWVDLIDPHGPARLTDLKDGTYVIFGPTAENNQGDATVYTDELLHLRVPGPRLRVKMSHNFFTMAYVDNPGSLAITSIARQGTYGIQFIERTGTFTYDEVVISGDDIANIRIMQFDVVNAAKEKRIQHIARPMQSLLAL